MSAVSESQTYQSHAEGTMAKTTDRPATVAVEGTENEVGAEAGATQGEERKAEEAGSGPRRSSRIKHPLPTAAKVEANGSKRGPGRKRSAGEGETGEHAEGGEAKKKAKTQQEEGIPLGSELPDLTLKNEKEEDVRLLDLQGESKGVVFFLIPKADTPGCNTQACGYRDAYSEFEQHNFKVVCVSADTPKQQAKWKTKKNIPYQFLSDPKRALIGALGAGTARTIRSHFIFMNNKLVDKKIPVKPADSPRLAIEFIKSFKAEEAVPSADAKEKKEEKGKMEITEPETSEIKVPEEKGKDEEKGAAPAEKAETAKPEGGDAQPADATVEA